MSFEVFLQCFRYGEPAGLPRLTVRSLFPVLEAESEPNYWSIHYDDLNHCKILVIPLASDESQVHSLCVERPCGDAKLWEAIFSVMKLGPVMFYFPGNAPPIIASESTEKHLPDGIVQGMGKPHVVRAGLEIHDIILNN